MSIISLLFSPFVAVAHGIVLRASDKQPEVVAGKLMNKLHLWRGTTIGPKSRRLLVRCCINARMSQITKGLKGLGLVGYLQALHEKYPDVKDIMNRYNPLGGEDVLYILGFDPAKEPGCPALNDYWIYRWHVNGEDEEIRKLRADMEVGATPELAAERTQTAVWAMHSLACQHPEFDAACHRLMIGVHYLMENVTTMMLIAGQNPVAKTTTNPALN